MNELKKENYRISGMHCRSCEMIIEEHLLKVRGVKKVNVSQSKGMAEIYFEQRPVQAEVEKAIKAAGYTPGAGKKRPLISRDAMTYIELAFAGGILLLLYIWLKFFGVLDLNLQFSSSPTLLVVLLIGLTAGISTCMALVGGLVLGISTRHAALHPEATPGQRFKPHLFFNLGRLMSYGILGGIFGLIGSVFQFSSQTLGLIVIAAGVIMFSLGLKMTGVFPRLEGGFTMPKAIGRLFGIRSEVKEYSHRSAFLTGAATFFLPCGFTQAMQVYAISTGSFSKGAVIMFLFALGTIPGLLGIGGLTSIIKGAPARYFFKFVALVLLILSIWNISNGFNLTGITLGSADGDKQVKVDSKMVDGQQVLEMTQLATAYKPNKLTVRKGIPVRLLVNATNIYSCSSILVIPKFKIYSRLNEGINEINFTPTETGPIKFSCAMGMYTGVINVVN